MYNRVENKRIAKDLLRGNASCILTSSIFWKFILAFIIQFSLGIVVSFLGIIPIIGTLLLIAFLPYSGIALINLCKVLYETHEIDFMAMFNFISDWKFLLKTLAILILYGLMVGIGCMFLIVPGIYLMLRFCLVVYIINDNHDIGIIDSFKKSAELMNGRKVDLLVLQLSMLGWVLLGYITFGIGFIYLTVYMSVILYVFYVMTKNK